MPRLLDSSTKFLMQSKVHFIFCLCFIVCTVTEQWANPYTYTTTWNVLVVICQKVITFLVSGEKSKHRWNNIHSMAEAKAGLQALLNMVSMSVSSFLASCFCFRQCVGRCTTSRFATILLRANRFESSFFHHRFRYTGINGPCLSFFSCSFHDVVLSTRQWRAQ